MSDQGFPVTVEVRRADGSVEHVRVGTAVRNEDGFSLKLGELSIGSTPDARRAAPSGAPAYGGGAAYGGGSAGGDGMIFPPYGRSKGMPIAGATMQDLEFYANGSRRSLGDPSKSRWHDKERVLLAAIETEIARQRGESPPEGEGPPPLGDEDIPF